MSEKAVENVMGCTMDKIKEMVDVNAVIGDPITTPDGTCIIPVSKINYGFASGGSDLPNKGNKEQNLFGGAGGAGVTVTPIAFLYVSAGNARLMQIDPYNSAVDRIIEMAPDLISKVTNLIKTKTSKKEKNKTDDDLEEKIDILEEDLD